MVAAPVKVLLIAAMVVVKPSCEESLDRDIGRALQGNELFASSRLKGISIISCINVIISSCIISITINLY